MRKLKVYLKVSNVVYILLLVSSFVCALAFCSTGDEFELPFKLLLISLLLGLTGFFGMVFNSKLTDEIESRKKIKRCYYDR